jgi:hypothetical protein
MCVRVSDRNAWFNPRCYRAAEKISPREHAHPRKRRPMGTREWIAVAEKIRIRSNYQKNKERTKKFGASAESCLSKTQPGQFHCQIILV